MSHSFFIHLKYNLKQEIKFMKHIYYKPYVLPIQNYICLAVSLDFYPIISFSI